MFQNSDFIVEGKGFVAAKIEGESISKINQRIGQFMYYKLFTSENPFPYFFNQILFANTFYRELSKDTPKSFKLKKALGLMSNDEFLTKRFHLNLQNTRRELPYRVIVSVSYAKRGNDDGFLITMRSEPIVIYQRNILGWKYDFSESDYNDIIDTNKDFITEAMNAVGFIIVEKPRVVEDSSDLKKVITITPTLFKIPDKSIRKNCVGVMMPIKKEFDGVLESIKKACSNVNMSCYRADDIWKDSTIIQDVFELIYRSSIVIADFSGKNPNVFYEAGIAHTLGKDVIPITQHINDIPFDLQPHRTLKYLNNSEGLKQLSEGLEERLKTLKNK